MRLSASRRNFDISAENWILHDAVKEGEDLVELVTDKATFNLPAPAAGILKEVLVNEGDEAAVGQVLARIE